MFDLELLKQKARKIKHSGDYGFLYWHPKNQIVFWAIGNSDGHEINEGDENYTTPLNTIEKIFLQIPFVKTVKIVEGTNFFKSDELRIHEGVEKIEYK